MGFMESKVIILCSTQRSGSTMVVEDMRNTGIMGNPEEYFIPWDSLKVDIDWNKQLDSLTEKASSKNGVIAVKVMANQLPEIDQCLKNTWPDELPAVKETGIFPYFREVTKHGKYIFLRRDNLLRQAISRSVSRQTGINHATANDFDEHFAGKLLKGYSKDYNESISYNEKVLSKDLMNIVNENTIWECFFRDWDIKHPLTLRYEEICKNSPSYLQRIANYTKITLNDFNFDRKMVKLSNEKNEEWYNNYINHIENQLSKNN